MMRKVKYFFPLLLTVCLMLIPAVSALAADADSTVSYDGTQLSRSETKTAGETLAGLLPGEEGSYVVEFVNNSDKDTDWYVLNSVIDSFEDAGDASGGAYEYSLTLLDSEGTSTVLYSNQTVGGVTEGSSPVGLHQAAEGLEDFFYLTSLKAGEKGSIQLNLAIDGESQLDSYMNTVAKLNIQFAVETPETTTVASGQTKTGDTANATLYIAAAAAALVVIIVLVLVMIRRRANAKSK